LLFNSFEFIFIFLPVVFLGYFSLCAWRLTEVSKAWLVAGSLFFYGWWNPLYLPLILASALVNYAVGRRLGSPAPASTRISSRTLLVTGVTFNLTLLGYFKYTDFLIGNVNAVFSTSVPLTRIALPLAISFFTFQQIAYLVDSYRREAREYDLLNYLLFVTFFPQLIAGPIVHHREMMPQFASRRRLVKRYRNIATGLFVFSIGLFKKVVLADTFAQWASQGFDTMPSLTMLDAWATSLSYSFQLYFDFSGYTDMAIGAALLFNIRLPANFNSPYKAVTIQDFWRRWHITLSRFLREYVYVPLGGNRGGAFRTNVNLCAVFLLGGLWHGASWMFVVWGALHGVALVIQRLWQRAGFAMPALVASFITFNFVNITWVFFRARTMDDAVKVMRGMVGMSGLGLPGAPTEPLTVLERVGLALQPETALADASRLPLWMLAGAGIVFLCRNSLQLSAGFTASRSQLLFAAVLLLAGLVYSGGSAEFIYFDF
jgi:D-alanyl-lipoteichoic acid acyltransferase DltB (MBOAT superfamily)